MDVNGIQGISSSNSLITDSAKKQDISSSAKKIQDAANDLERDTFVKSEEKDASSLTYKPVKNKLSAEEIKALKEEQESLKADMIKTFINDTINNQKKLLGKSTDDGTNKMSKETSDLLTKIFGSVENAYPPMATTPEGAKEAISEGGAYSIDAVADRIMTMAKYIAGDDPDKIQQMREAVEKGFKQAGMDFKNATNSNLPQICIDTCSEVMKRFDELQNKE